MPSVAIVKSLSVGLCNNTIWVSFVVNEFKVKFELTLPASSVTFIIISLYVADDNLLNNISLSPVLIEKLL